MLKTVNLTCCLQIKNQIEWLNKRYDEMSQAIDFYKKEEEKNRLKKDSITSQFKNLLGNLASSNEAWVLFLLQKAPLDSLSEHLFGYMGSITNDQYFTYGLINVLLKGKRIKLILSNDYDEGLRLYESIGAILDALGKIFDIKFLPFGESKKGYWLILEKE